MKAQTLSVEYEGVTYTRTTSRSYQFASVVQAPNGGIAVPFWTNSRKAADKAGLTADQRANGVKVIAVLEVQG